MAEAPEAGPTEAQAPAAAHAFVSGKVQGVFFRKHTQRQAQALGLVGWVRNLPDGRVELTAEGPAAGVAALLQWCEHRGSPKSRVDGVEVRKVPYTGQFSAFDVAK